MRCDHFAHEPTTHTRLQATAVAAAAAAASFGRRLICGSRRNARCYVRSLAAAAATTDKQSRIENAHKLTGKSSLSLRLATDTLHTHRQRMHSYRSRHQWRKYFSYSFSFSIFSSFFVCFQCSSKDNTQAFLITCCSVARFLMSLLQEKHLLSVLLLLLHAQADADL